MNGNDPDCWGLAAQVAREQRAAAELATLREENRRLRTALAVEQTTCMGAERVLRRAEAVLDAVGVPCTSRCGMPRDAAGRVAVLAAAARRPRAIEAAARAYRDARAAEPAAWGCPDAASVGAATAAIEAAEQATEDARDALFAALETTAADAAEEE